MNRLLSIILTAILTFAAIMVSGANETRVLTKADGLSSTHVRDFIEDRHGNLWIATWVGVDRFDGLRHRPIRRSASKTEPKIPPPGT